MENSNHINELLSELKDATGIQFSIPDEAYDSDHLKDTEKKLSKLIRGFEGNRSKGFFFQKYLTGALSPDEIEEEKLLFHMDKASPWALFLLTFDKPYEHVVEQVLSSMSSPGADHTVKISEKELVLIRQLKKPLSLSEMRETAASFVDVLSMDALQNVKVSYDKCSDDFSELPAALENARSAYRIGTEFSVSDAVYGYHELGMGKVIDSLDPAICQEYLDDMFHGFNFDEIDQETLNTIKIFFDSGLSVAETARSLYVHRNTLVYRLDKLQKLTGLDIRKYEDAVIFSSALLMHKHIKNARG